MIAFGYSFNKMKNMETDILILPQPFGSILRYASLAPGSHNCQPWTVHLISETEWSIQADASRRLPAVDRENRETVLSIGAFWN